ncbi:MAG TPA: DUF1998 domain-containing protein, partial [Myxococcota bacterium]|nr:DUF1998 domain-containing protein [Myxococcota bacterium]
AGRAGRRHRMAVDITYAQATGFDQSYFRDPLKLLRGQVDPPRFNLKNEVMIRKHIHATVLTTLHGLARRHLKTHFDTIHAVLSRCFPPTLRSYLFSPNGSILPQVQDVSELGSLTQNWRAEILEVVQVVYRDAWPAEDREAVQPQQLAAAVDGMANTLQTVLHRFKRRLDWALGELRRLEQVQREKGTLDREDEAHRSRCERMIKRLKGEIRRSRSSAEGGGDDSETMGALAREAFLPGYGLEAGSVVATAVPPRLTEGLDDFEFPRPPVLAVREYVPGNAIYANGLRFVPRRFQLSADEVLRFTVLVEQQVVQEAGSYGGQSSLATREIRAVPICDVGMPAQSHISDEEDFRFQMPVAMYGSDRGFHRGGHAWAWGTIEMHFRRGVQLRLVNVGPRKEVAQGSLGYSLCLACGQSLSPYSSATALQDFVKKHMERCQHPVQPTGFYADVEVDTLALKGVASREVGFSIAESLRMGAAKVLDMEVEDLQLLSLGQPGAEEVDLLLYDPMPGGSGLLEQLLERWEDVRQAALELVLGCPGACERACVDCLQSYRNRFYHEHLNRFCAAEYLGRADLQPVVTHPLPEKLPRIQATTGQAQTHIEAHFQKLVREAGLPDPVCQHTISLGSAGKTIPDFFYASEDEPGICIFLDGMSGQIHGNPEQAGRDRHLRESLRSEGYEVIEVRSFDLEDRKAMTGALARIAKYLMLRERQQAIKNDTSWFDRARGS